MRVDYKNGTVELGYTDNNSVIDKYVSVLYKVAKERNLLPRISDQLQMIKECIVAMEGSEELLKRASMMKNFGTAFINTLKSNLNLIPELCNFLDLLRVNKRLQLITEFCDGFKKYQEALDGKKYFFISTAQAMNKKSQEELKDRLQSVFGGKIELILRKDPSILGGIIIRYRSKVLDYSVKSRIMRLHSAIRGESYEN